MIAIGLAIQVMALLLVLILHNCKHRALPFAILSFAASIIMALGYGRYLLSGIASTYTISFIPLIPPSVVILDPLAAFFGLIFAFGFPLGLLYGSYYIKAHPAEGITAHLFWLGLMIISMHLVLMFRNSLLFMIAWELMSLSSFFAILYERDNKETIANALYYFVMMHIGAAVLLAGFGMLYLRSGSFNFANSYIYNPAKWLLLIGFAFKAGFFPFYSWLPKAHPVAPAHLSGLMSGLMIKTGIFGIIYVLLQSLWQPYELYILLGIALLTAFNGVIHAMAETNIKRSLAYSSIENIGIIGIGLCFWQLGIIYRNPVMASLGFTGALLHTLNHSLFKPLLFYLSGNVLLATHTLEPDSLGGLGKRMPVTSLLFLGGTAAISSLPIMNGFVSELAILLSILSGFTSNNLGSTLASITAGAGFAFVSALALIAFSKVFSIVFGGEPRSAKAAQATEVNRGLLISPAILGFACLVLGVFCRLGLQFIIPLAPTFSISPVVLASFSESLYFISIVLFMVIIGFIGLYFAKNLLKRKTQYPTWACGYWKATPRLQYTGSAFINPLAYFLKPLMYKSTAKQRVEGYFPKQIAYTEEVRDYLDRGLICYICKGVKRFYSLVDGIHNGKTNSYISYLLLTLIVLLIWVLGVAR